MNRSATLPALAALLLAGCAAVPHSSPEVARLQPQAVGLGDQHAALDAHWWAAFRDPQLDRLVELGLAGNPSLEAALARVRGAQAAIGVAHAGQLPQIDVDGQLQEERYSEKYLIPPPFAGATRFASTLQASLSWDLDLFGRQKAKVAQARSGAEAAALDVAAARLAISTGIAQTYIGLAQAERQIDVARGFVATRTTALDYVLARIRNNLASEFDRRTAETLLAEAQQAALRAERQRDLLVHALAAMAGRGADFYPSVTRPMLALNTPPVVPAILPADLLGRRPDVLAGQARIDAAVSRRAAARADFLPNVNLQALAGLASIGFGNFLAAGSGTFSAGGAIHIPIFEGGKLRAQYRNATADLDAAIADYNGLVLHAVQQTADAITGIHASDADLREQDRVVAGLRDTVRLDEVRTATGLGSNLDAIGSGVRLLEAEQALVNLQADALTRRVQLIAALGGGFVPTQPQIAAQKMDSHI